MAKHSFIFPLDADSRAGAVKPFREGDTDFVVPNMNVSGAAELLTNLPLKATEVYNQYGQDRLGDVLISKVRGYAFADKAGSLYVEESDDGNSWSTVKSLDVSENALGDTGWVYLSKRYYRFRYVNGNLEQSDFALYQSLGAGEQDVRVSGGLESPSLEIPADGLPVKALKTNITQSYLEEQTIKAGESVYLNIDALGTSIGIAIYLNGNAKLSVRMTYIIPETSNYTLKGYEDVIVLDNGDRDARRVELLSSSPRLMLTNNGETEVKVKNLVVTHFL
ncbi:MULTISPECIES: hypothetical protein [Bacillus]|uniref:Phage-like element PBSX protein XepA n=1 Tax=Bacillus sonorensis TaxID=119858 RepID=A0ABN5ACH9_9BACI|nr:MULTISPECIES: hypothetical protein [Bacillus]ASB88450.1 Phage-like element PBSX protein XepA [Bacillus sonorensis]NWN81241.1 hypothetical protein [Bacillus sp. (in: firmicutes)]RHJ05928.1 hypothetical protein DW143_21520 [Bacillus sonorensis]GIN67696.1 hypothetical protein J41TS2_31170 [Bacillus sonorensis]